MGKKKRATHIRNTTGLRNQPRTAPSTADSPPSPPALPDDDSDEEWDTHQHTDSLKTDWAAESDSEDELAPGNEADLVEDEQDKCWNDGPSDSSKGLFVQMMQFAIEEDDDPRDEDWMPPGLRAKGLKKKAKSNRIGIKYKGGKNPDIGSKAPRTQRRHKKLLHNQTSLTQLHGFTRGPAGMRSLHRGSTNVKVEADSPPPNPLLVSTHIRSPSIPIRVESPKLPSLEFLDREIRQESLTPPPLSFIDDPVLLGARLAPSDDWATPPPETLPNSLYNSPRVRTAEMDDGVQGKRRSSVTVEALEEETRDGEAGNESSGETPAGDFDDWEEELNECVLPVGEFKGWWAMREGIKMRLVKESKTLPAAHVNRLMILRNFCTLQLKGYGWMDASRMIAEQWDETKSSNVHFARRVRALVRHYQVYEDLPVENRGGFKNCHSLLKDEAVQSAARTWLSTQTSGEVTPERFQNGLNEEILPSLGLSTEKPLCARTARRWLIKLGWARTRIKQGVYMDGHERPDVVDYRMNIFLPRMEEYQRRMARYEGPELKRVEPELKEGERELIAEFQDESCCQANEYHSSAWLRKDEHVLIKKSRGRLVHISNFVEEGNGRLVVRNNSGNIVKQARKIIYPGASGDPYWDCDQLIAQVENQAIPVFEEAHPGCQALFIFDQSTAHAALPPDSLKAFEMNKSNGGKQRLQKDTTIPPSNPFPEFRGRPQEMTVPGPNGTRVPKGLEQTLRERGFDVKKFRRAKCSPVCPFENDDCCMARVLSKQDDFVNQTSRLELVIKEAGHECIFLPKFHCELNPIEMYWGWVKYRYQQIPKKTFDEAKEAATRCLDACPTDVIRRFVNRSWRFLDAYRKGLTGKAASWAVRKYKGHRAISDGALTQLEASAPSARA